MIMARSSSPSSGSNTQYSGSKILIVTAILVPIQVFCVTLRYFVRYRVKGPWGLDDIVVVASLILQLAMAGVAIAAVKEAGVGYHMVYLMHEAPEKIVLWLKYLVVIEFISVFGVTMPKLAILALYHRLFPTRGFQNAVSALSGVLILLTVAFVLAFSFACRPFSANWDLSRPDGACINKTALFIWASVPNIITDVVILVLPAPLIWRLHTSTRLKIGLTITFAVGSLGLITSIIRFATFLQKSTSSDETWATIDLIIWTEVETAVYLICACLPTYRPLLDCIGCGPQLSRSAIEKRKNSYVTTMTKEKPLKVYNDIYEVEQYQPRF